MIGRLTWGPDPFGLTYVINVLRPVATQLGGFKTDLGCMSC
jgi:hypothetical protein